MRALIPTPLPVPKYLMFVYWEYKKNYTFLPFLALHFRFWKFNFLFLCNILILFSRNCLNMQIRGTFYVIAKQFIKINRRMWFFRKTLKIKKKDKKGKTKFLKEENTCYSFKNNRQKRQKVKKGDKNNGTSHYLIHNGMSFVRENIFPNKNESFSTKLIATQMTHMLLFTITIPASLVLISTRMRNWYFGKVTLSKCSGDWTTTDFIMPK